MLGPLGTEGLMVNTEFSFKYDNLYVRAATKNANFPDYLPVILKVCGFEKVIPKDNFAKNIKMTPIKNIYSETKSSLK